MGNSVSEYEAVHNLMVQKGNSGSGINQSSSDFAKTGCVPNALGRVNFLPDKTVCILNLIKERAHLTANVRNVGYQSASIQKVKSTKYHSKIMREFLAGWNVNDLFALVEEYENLHTLKSFVQLSSKARQYASTCRNDLANLIDSNLLADVQLVYETINKGGQKVQMGPPIQCHKAILAARSEYFKQLFMKYRTTNSFYISSQVDPNVSYEMFSHFIRYLYSNTHDPKILSSYYLNFLLSKFKCNRGFKEALNYLRFSDTQLSDSVLLFKNSNPQKQDVPVPLIYQCHKSVLCARSKFFSSYLKRKAVNQNDLTSSTTNDSNSNANSNVEFNGATQIVLDTEIVNPKYGRILMDALYLDTIDLRNITSISMNFAQENSSSEENCSGSKTGSLKSSNVISDAMELYVIAGLLDVPVLAQGCEDIILRRMSESSVVRVISWAAESHGSKYVYRQCVQFIVDEFATFSQSEHFLQLNQEVLVEVLQSDFVQASELQILKAVMRWAQFQIDSKDLSALDSAGLLDEYNSSQTSTSYEPCSSSSVGYHRSASSTEARPVSIQDATPGEIIPSVSTDFELLNSTNGGRTSDSSRRKTNWRQRLSHRRRQSLGTSSDRNSCSSTSVDSEACKMDKLLLRVAAPLLSLVRVAHVIPKTSTTYSSAVKRKLITVPYIADAPANLHQSLENTSNGWIRSANFGDYCRPRLFLPYFNEAKIALADRLSSGLSYEQLRFLKDYRARVQNNQVPDNLYMVDPRERSHSLTRTRSCPSVRHPSHVTTSASSAKLSSLVPIPDQEALRKMIAREHELQNSTDVKQALAQTTTNKLAIQREIQKSVVREFGYPDDVIEVLQNPLDYYNLENLQFLAEDALENIASNVLGFAQVSTPRAPGQLQLMQQKEKVRPTSQVELTFDRIVSPAKSVTAAEINMMTSALTFPETLQDAEQENNVNVPKYSSRTLPSNRSGRNRILQDSDAFLMNNPPNIVPMGGIPCDLIPRKSASRPTQLPFADILQDINMTAAQHSDPANDTPAAPQSTEVSVACSTNSTAATPCNKSQTAEQILPNKFNLSSNKSSEESSVQRPSLISKPSFHKTVLSNKSPGSRQSQEITPSEQVPILPPRVPIKPSPTTPVAASNVPSHNRQCGEFRCYKHLAATSGPSQGVDENPPPIPPRNSLLITNPHAANSACNTASMSNAAEGNAAIISPGLAAMTRKLPPDLTLPSSVPSQTQPQQTPTQRMSWFCNGGIELCRSNHTGDFSS